MSATVPALPAGAPVDAAARAPGALTRFLPVYRRNFMVWRKLAGPSLVANVADPLITLVAFGYGLGALVPTVAGVRYVEFLAAGALCMSAMMSASFEALYSAFSRMHVQRTWESIMNAPLTLDDVLRAEWLWAATKSLVSSIAIVLVLLALGVSRAPTLALVVPVAVLTGLCFSALALCCNALARNYDFFSYYFTLVLTPMVFVSGVYYPAGALPPWLAALAQWLPLTSAVELARPLVLGQWPARVAVPLAVLIAYTTAGWFLARTLTRRRFRA